MGEGAKRVTTLISGENLTERGARQRAILHASSGAPPCRSERRLGARARGRGWGESPHAAARPALLDPARPPVRRPHGADRAVPRPNVDLGGRARPPCPVGARGAGRRGARLFRQPARTGSGGARPSHPGAGGSHARGPALARCRHGAARSHADCRRGRGDEAQDRPRQRASAVEAARTGAGGGDRAPGGAPGEGRAACGSACGGCAGASPARSDSRPRSSSPC